MSICPHFADLLTTGKTIAILQNETSEMMGVERALKLQDDSGVFGEMLEISNGCVCCSVRSDFILAINSVREVFHWYILRVHAHTGLLC